jgi:hypothetical protein
MNTSARNTPDPFSGLRPQAPPAGLKGRVLKAAGEAMTAPAPDRWTLLWRNPAARAVWAFTVALLLLGHMLVHFPLSARPRTNALLAERQAPELTEIISLPRINTDLLLFAGSSDGNGGAHKPQPPAAEKGRHTKETRS